MPPLDNLGARLHLEESNLKLRSGNSSGEALVMRFRHMICQRPQRKSFGHHASAAVESGGRPNYEPSRGPSNFRGDVIFCFRCNQQGHIARYCVAPSSVVQPPRRQSFGAHTEEMILDNEESFQTALQALSLESEDNNWIIDSGASRHFSGNAQAFTDLEPSCLYGTAVSAADTNHAIHGQGSVNVPSSSGEIKKISSVYYLPGLNRNLLSVGQFTEMGCMVVFDERKCVVVTKLTPCRILATGIRNPGNGLYVLKSVSENLEINSIVLDLPNHMHHNFSALEVNSLSCPSQIVLFSK